MPNVKLEYYTGMIFQPYIPELKREIGGGGRYNKLIELFGGEPTPAVGVAHGIDRLVYAIKEQKPYIEKKSKRHVMVIPASEEMKAKAIELSLMLRNNAVPTEVEVTGRTMSKALRDANRREITHVIIVGPEELKKSKVVLRNMKEEKQDIIEIEKVAHYLVNV